MSVPVFMQRVQDLVIDPEEILSLVQEMAERRDEDLEVDWETSVFILVARYRDPDRVVCISERMRCLASMMKDDRMRGWTIGTQDPKCVLTNEAVFHAYGEVLFEGR